MADERIDEEVMSFFDSMTDAQKEKAKACSDQDEFMRFADEEGIEIPDGLLEQVAGGGFWRKMWRLIVRTY